jgi:predicted DNA-binding protein with PD1-like motif
MKYSQAAQGRTFIIRLEDGDILHEAVERFAADKGIRAATPWIKTAAEFGEEG